MGRPREGPAHRSVYSPIRQGRLKRNRFLSDGPDQFIQQFIRRRDRACIGREGPLRDDQLGEFVGDIHGRLL